MEQSKIQVNDIVQFEPINDEIYYSLVPKHGTRGIVKLLSYNVGLMQMFGVMLEMCLVKFDTKEEIVVYAEDLVLIERSSQADFLEELQSRTPENVN